MRSFKRSKTREVPDFTQLGLDFAKPSEYSTVPRKETYTMNQELFEILDNKVTDLVEKYTALREENSRITQENQQLRDEREGLKTRVDAILGKDKTQANFNYAESPSDAAKADLESLEAEVATAQRSVQRLKAARVTAAQRDTVAAKVAALKVLRANEAAISSAISLTVWGSPEAMLRGPT